MGPVTGSPHILIVDSGLGGLSVVQQVRARLPNAALSYLADYALFPYGERAEAEIVGHLPGTVAGLCAQIAPDIVVLACNTASTAALPALRERVSAPVVGTVPAIRPAVALSRTGAIGLLGTPGTVNHPYTDDLIEEFASGKTVLRYGSAALVREAEALFLGGRANQGVVAAELRALMSQPGGERMDVIVLACTHFPFLRGPLITAAPRLVQFIDSGEAIARRVAQLLDEAPAPPKGTAGEAGRAFVTGAPSVPPLERVMRRFGFREVVLMLPEGRQNANEAPSPP